MRHDRTMRESAHGIEQAAGERREDRARPARRERSPRVEREIPTLAAAVRRERMVASGGAGCPGAFAPGRSGGCPMSVELGRDPGGRWER